jgi:hypothetical protein
VTGKGAPVYPMSMGCASVFEGLQAVARRPTLRFGKQPSNGLPNPLPEEAIMTTQSQPLLPVPRLTMLAGGLDALLTFAPPGSAEDLPKQGNFGVTYTAAGTLTRTVDLGDGSHRHLQLHRKESVQLSGAVI